MSQAGNNMELVKIKQENEGLSNEIERLTKEKNNYYETIEKLKMIIGKL